MAVDAISSDATIILQLKEDTMTPLRQKMLEDMQLHGLSERTQQSYVWAVKGLADFFHRSPAELVEEEIRQFFLHLIDTRQVAKSTVTVYLSGIKFFCDKTLGHTMPILDLVRPKRTQEAALRAYDRGDQKHLISDTLAHH